MRVIILAAGRGKRLDPITDSLPKYLVDIGGMTLMDHQMANLLKTKIAEEVILVTGYRAESVRSQISKYRRWHKIREVFCPNYLEHNNLISLWQARGCLGDDFVIINGDNVFDYSVLEKLAAQQAEACLTIVKRVTYVDGDMKVIFKGDRLDQVSKGLPNGEADGISIGIMRFRGEGARAFSEKLEQMATDEGNRQEYYLRVVERLAQEFPIKGLEVPNQHWTDIDDQGDLERVRKEFGAVIGSVLEPL